MGHAGMKGRWIGKTLLIVISSPSGGGKSTIIKMLRQRHPEFLYSVSTTTRDPRRGERNRIHYTFVANPEFERLIRSKQLVEWARVHDHYYGTPRVNVARARRLRRVMLFDLDVQGAATVRREIPDVVTIFLLPPSWEVLRKRLEGRHSESPSQRRRRLRTAREEMKRRNEYDYWVVNRNRQTCVSECEAIIRAELLRATRRA